MTTGSEHRRLFRQSRDCTIVCSYTLVLPHDPSQVPSATLVWKLRLSCIALMGASLCGEAICRPNFSIRKIFGFYYLLILITWPTYKTEILLCPAPSRGAKTSSIKLNWLSSWGWLWTFDYSIFSSRMLGLQAYTTSSYLWRTGDQSRGFIHARQACYQLSSISIPVFPYLNDGLRNHWCFVFYYHWWLIPQNSTICIT